MTLRVVDFPYLMATPSTSTAATTATPAATTAAASDSKSTDFQFTAASSSSPVVTGPVASSFGTATDGTAAGGAAKRKVKIIERPKSSTTGTETKETSATSVADEKELIDGIRAAFAQWDLDKDNAIDATEVGKVLTAAGVKPTKTMIDGMITSMDADKDGRISWEEFKTAYLRKFKVHEHTLSSDVETEMEAGLRSRKH